VEHTVTAACDADETTTLRRSSYPAVSKTVGSGASQRAGSLSETQGTW
jgi:hypothetical protein